MRTGVHPCGAFVSHAGHISQALYGGAVWLLYAAMLAWGSNPGTKAYLQLSILHSPCVPSIATNPTKPMHRLHTSCQSPLPFPKHPSQRKQLLDQPRGMPQPSVLDMSYTIMGGSVAWSTTCPEIYC